MPQPNQGKCAPGANTSQPISDKSGSMKSDAIATPIHPAGTRGK